MDLCIHTSQVSDYFTLYLLEFLKRTMVQYLYLHLDKELSLGVTFIDLKKQAFDAIDHDIRVAKLC